MGEGQGVEDREIEGLGEGLPPLPPPPTEVVLRVGVGERERVRVGLPVGDPPVGERGGEGVCCPPTPAMERVGGVVGLWETLVVTLELRLTE